MMQTSTKFEGEVMVIKSRSLRFLVLGISAITLGLLWGPGGGGRAGNVTDLRWGWFQWLIVRSYTDGQLPTPMTLQREYLWDTVALAGTAAVTVVIAAVIWLLLYRRLLIQTRSPGSNETS